MSSRELARVLIRVLGVGFLAYFAMSAGFMALQMLVNSSFGRDVGWAVVGYVVFPLLISMLLIAGGAWIADRFRIGVESSAGSPAERDGAALSPDTLFRIGCALIGVYCLTRIANPLATVLWVSSDAHGLSLKAPLSEIGLELVIGLALLIGPGRIGRWSRRTFTAAPPSD